MARYQHSSWWSQLGWFLFPFIAVGAIYLLTVPQYSQRPIGLQPPPPGAAPEPANFIPGVPFAQDSTFEDLSPQKLVEVVELMAAMQNAQTGEAESPAPIPASAPVAAVPEEPAPQPDAPRFRARTWAGDLASPDGLAIDPRTGNIFVSEESANRIVMFTPKGQRRVVADASTRLTMLEGRYRHHVSALTAPEGLAMDGFGHLYVAEDRPGGRILSLRVDRRGRVESAEVVPLPGDWQRYAWESIAVRDNGELLLAGSTAEAEMGLVGGLFQGIIVYRDREGRWWSPSMRPGASFSAVTFSKNGQYAIYGDEVAGTVGWIDLTSRDLREGASRHTFKSPEGLTVMPDGRVLVAQEGGQVVLLDPQHDQVLGLADNLGAIESVEWDPANRRSLVTSDGQGAVLELTPLSPWPETGDKMAYARCESEGSIRHVPKQTPAFLRPLLSAGGLADSSSIDKAFEQLTRRMPILAADSPAELVRGTGDILDPVTHIQFVAFDPNRLRFDEPGSEFPVSALILRTRSGQIYKTTLVRTVVLTGNMWLGKFENHGIFELPIPFAFQATVGPRGHAVIHFTGLGRSPDVSVAINPQNPQESYMTVTHLGGGIEQYRLQSGPGGSTENWVVSLPPRRPQAWLPISAPDNDAPPAEDQKI